MTTIPIGLQNWQARWGVDPLVMADLLQTLGVGIQAPTPQLPHFDRVSEAYVQSVVRLEAPRYGVHLFRNNVGALPDRNGRLVRYGLANESAQQNETVKSGDLIGWRSFIIEQRHVGARFAQFVSRECKKVTWSFGEDRKKEEAQMAWAGLVTRAGGDACFVQGEGSFK